MGTEGKAMLEGGPEELNEQIVSVDRPGDELKLPFRNGYEHFIPTQRRADTSEGPVSVYEWTSRTEMAN
ncbi:DUF5988 family protein [Nocardiopsis protaetiae]|uniref:DUF5988 family protein n=1 Tax=Nocardiopsis protaetiae TaxID=3382270 RepID=UPI00387B24E4